MVRRRRVLRWIDQKRESRPDSETFHPARLLREDALICVRVWSPLRMTGAVQP